jgi:agmatine/peptidylarginine deiminase
VFEDYYEYVMRDNLDFVLEGGSIESDGKGTVFTTSQCLLAPNRNQPLTKKGIEEYLKKTLCAEQIVWLDYGNLIGDDTDGHIDTIVRIAPNDTILYVKCEDKNDEQFDDFKALENQLQSLRTKESKPYRLLPLPMPKAMYDNGDRLPATYANFLIINGAVLVPTYNQPDLDKKAMDIIQQAFHDREIIGIDAQVAVRQHGSLHCLTMQFPA